MVQSQLDEGHPLDLVVGHLVEGLYLLGDFSFDYLGLLL